MKKEYYIDNIDNLSEEEKKKYIITLEKELKKYKEGLSVITGGLIGIQLALKVTNPQLDNTINVLMKQLDNIMLNNE